MPLRNAIKVLLLWLCALVFIQIAYAQNITKPNIAGPSGLSVNSYTGSLFCQRTDLFIPGRGLSLDITFAYNSADRSKDNGFGYGWTFHYNLFYVTDSTGIIVYRGDGRADHFTLANNAYVPDAGIFDVLEQYEAGKFRLTTNDKTQYFFEDGVHKKLTRIKERNSNEMLFAYTGSRLATITDASNRKVTLTWTGNRLTSVRGEAASPARIITYEYNSAGCLVAVRKPLGITIRYAYGPNRVMNQLTDANGNVSYVSYNSSSAVIKLASCSQDKSISYNTAQRKTYVVEKNNDKTILTSYEFDEHKRLINKTGNCCGFKVTYAYDDNNNISQATDANGSTTLYTYDAKGNLLSETDPLGKSAFYTYEPSFSKPASITDKNGNKTQYAYDARGNLLQLTDALNNVSSYTYDDKGNRLTSKNKRGHTTTYEYDQFGYVIKETDPDGGVETFTYDAWGNSLTYTNANNHTATNTFDELNRLITVTDPLGGVTKYAYDGNGNAVSVTDPNNHTTSYVYNSENKPIAIIDAAGNATVITYDQLGNVRSRKDANNKTLSYAYDNMSRLIAEANAANEKKTYTYDGNGNKISITYPNGNKIDMKYDVLNRAVEVKDKLGIIISYTYDASSNKLTETDGKGNTTTYRYDKLNRLIMKTDPLGNAYQYVYDAGGNLVTETDRNNNTIIYAYDALNRMVSETNMLGHVTAYSYDKTGNTTSVTDAGGNKTIYTYDALKRNTEEKFADNSKTLYTYDAAGNLVGRTDGRGQFTGYTYDKLDRLIIRAYPGTSDSLFYDPAGYLVKAWNPNATVVFSYDAAYRLKSETLNGKLTQYDYNTAEGIQRIEYPGGRMIEKRMNFRDQLKSLAEHGVVIAEFGYDAAGQNNSRGYINNATTSLEFNGNTQVTKLSHNPSRFVDIGYTYDKERNPLTAQFQHRPANSEQYTYDKENQLTGFNKGASAPSVFNYDGVGNRTTAQVNGVAITYAVTNMNAYSTIQGAGQVNLLYDANGNMIADGGNAYSYDAENRMTSVNNGSTATYLYDALGRRIKKLTASDSINYYFDGLQIIEERDNSDVVKATYVWGTWLDDIVSMRRNGQNYYYHSNSLGSVVAVTDSGAKVVERYEYNAFGEVSFYSGEYVSLTGSAVGNTYTFSGRQHEPETGLYYYRARSYNAAYGRFMQYDPSGYEDGLNLYAYTANNPTTRLDPLGMSWWDDVGDFVWEHTPTLEDAANFSAGFADGLTFGATEILREKLDINDGIDKCSGAYKGGEYTEVGAELILTGGVAALKIAAKKASRKLVRRQARNATRHIARNGNELHHSNPLFGHPGNLGSTLFPTGGLPASIHSGRWNLQLLSKAEHMKAHRRLKMLERAGVIVVNPATTGTRLARAMDDDCDCKE